MRYLEQTAHEGRRWSAAVGYLKPAMRRPNLTVVTKAFVRRVLFEGQRCVGVEYEHRGQLVQARAHKEVILSAGTIKSPTCWNYRASVRPNACRPWAYRW